MKTFGKYIKDRRSKLGLTLIELWRKYDICYSTVCDIECGMKRPYRDKRKLEKLLKALKFRNLEIKFLIDVAFIENELKPPSLSYSEWLKLPRMLNKDVLII